MASCQSFAPQLIGCEPQQIACRKVALENLHLPSVASPNVWFESQPSRPLILVLIVCLSSSPGIDRIDQPGTYITHLHKAVQKLYANPHTFATAQQVTIAVPPALPACLTIATVFSIGRLRKRGVFVTSPDRIATAGQLDVIAFDKTGVSVPLCPYVLPVRCGAPHYPLDVLTCVRADTARGTLRDMVVAFRVVLPLGTN